MAEKKTEVIFVNREKQERAQDILALISGARHARDAGEEMRIAHYTAILKEGKIGPADEGALRYIYERLGGLIRTREEQEVADQHAEEMQTSNRRKAIQNDK